MQNKVLLVLGSESYLAERAVQAFVRRVKEVRPDASLTQISASGIDAGQLAEVAGSSLFAEQSILVVTELEDLPQSLFGQMLDLAENPGEDLALALVHSGVVKGKALVAGLKKLNIPIVAADPIKAWKLPDFVVEEAAAVSVRIPINVAAILVETIGSDLRALSAAVRQLLDDSTDGSITSEQINRYFAGQAEVTSFAVADAAMAGNLPEAMAKLRWATSAAVPPVLVTSAFARSLTNLGLYFEAQAEIRDQKELAAKVGVPYWKLKDFAKLARVWRPAGIAAAIKAVAHADAQVKGAGADPAFALERLVLQIYSLRNNA